jgi:hypothetical protein
MFKGIVLETHKQSTKDKQIKRSIDLVSENQL